MTIHNDISTWTALKAITIASGDTVNFTENSTITTNDNTRITINNATINGNGTTITFHSGRTVGIFYKCLGATINDIVINGGGNTLSAYHSLYMNYTGNMNDKYYGTINRCTATNVTLGTNGGGIVSALNNTNDILNLNECIATDITMGSGTGGLVGGINTNLNLVNCYASFTTINTWHTGCLVGINCGGNISLTGCHVNFVGNLQNDAGGMVARTSALSARITIVESFFLLTGGSLTGTMGSAGLFYGFYEMPSTSARNGIIDICNCYVVSNIADNNGPFFARLSQNNTININNCYHAGTLTSNGRSLGGINEANSSVVNATDVVIQSQTYTHPSFGQAGITILRTDISYNSITNRLPDGTDAGQTFVNGRANNFDSNIWSIDVGPYPRLTRFTTAPWSAYERYDASATLTGNSLAAPDFTVTDTIFYMGTSNTLTPINTGGEANWSITPALHESLTLDGSTGAISGITTYISVLGTNYILTAENETLPLPGVSAEFIIKSHIPEVTSALDIFNPAVTNNIALKTISNNRQFVDLSTYISIDDELSVKRSKRKGILDLLFAVNDVSVFNTSPSDLGLSYTTPKCYVYNKNQTVDMNTIKKGESVIVNISDTNDTVTFLNVMRRNTVVFTKTADAYSVTLNDVIVGIYNPGNIARIGGSLWIFGSVATDTPGYDMYPTEHVSKICSASDKNSKYSTKHSLVHK